MVNFLFKAASLVGVVKEVLVVLGIFAALYIWNRATGGQHIKWKGSAGRSYFEMDGKGQLAVTIALYVFLAYMVYSACSFFSVFWE